MNLYNTIIKLSKDTMVRYKPENLKWMWGEALLMHSFGLLQNQNCDIDYTSYIRQYVDAHIKKGYRVDQSDTLAPALAAYYLFKIDRKDEYKVIVDKAINYIFNAPKIIENMPNHLGHSLEGKFYPKSIWVDSIMMYGVFTSLYAKENNHEDLMIFAKTQPKFFAKYLQDRKDKLFYHCYWTKGKHTYPKRKIFWGRGNGWVIAGLPMLIDNIPEGEEKDLALKILQKTSEAMLVCQREDGFFETVLNKPGKTYIESSATALVAGGWLHAVRKGYLPPSYKDPALKSLQAVVTVLETKDNLLSMPLISAPTIAIQFFPYLGYKLTPRGNDWTYGLAALNFAAYQLKEGGYEES
jgi:unsaturated rhamnogalacturonyl hydrolase